MKKCLIEAGYTKTEINRYYKQGKIQKLDDELIIVDSELFSDFIIRLLNKSINPIVFFEYENNQNSFLYHVFKYISEISSELCALNLMKG